MKAALSWGVAVITAVLVQAAARAQNAPVMVSNAGATWTIAGKTRTVSLDAATLAMTIKSGTNQWRILPAAKDDLTVRSDSATATMRLTDARKVEIAPWQTGFQSGVRIQVSDFQQAGQPLDFSLRLFITLEHGSEDLICEAVPTEGKARIRELLWPRGFDPAAIDQTVVPFMQGMLLPRAWPQRVYLYDSISYGRGLYMPWWGQQQGPAAALTVLETPEDGGCRFEHPAGGPTRIQIRWIHSLGKLGYARRARICFLDDGNYVDMAKRYRRYIAETGRLVPLKEKIARSPLVGRLIGAPVIHTSILTHIQPQSSYYNKTNPAANHQVVTFDTRASQLKALAAKGIDHAYVHLDGWGSRGYDNLHPDILPPSAEAGGWDGMRRLADTCDAIGYVFAVHDQYRDFYHDAASYSPGLTVMNEDGGRPFGNTWFGGDQSILCSKLAPGYVARNHREILAHGIKLRGAYLDVFAVVPGDECYNPDHRVTRGQSLAYRAECFNLIRNLEGVVSSEEPADWAMPFIDLVHHAPFALDPNPGSGPAMGIPIPLHNLVYHDSLITPWSMTHGGWGIPKMDWGYLHALANAGIPYISMNPAEKELNEVRTVCALHRRVGLLEMTRHEFLDDSHRRQRTTFADGTRVTIDLDANKFEIAPPLSDEEMRSAFKRVP